MQTLSLGFKYINWLIECMIDVLVQKEPYSYF